MVFVYGFIMLVALVGMIICSKKQKMNPAMQPVAFVLFIVVVIGGIMLLKTTGTFGGTNNLLENELAFYSSQGAKAGHYFAQNNAGKKILLLVENKENRNVQLLADALQKGYAGEVITDTLALKQQPDPNMGMPFYMYMKAADFDAALAKHPDAGIVVSTIGLPQDALRMKFWKTPADKRPVLFLIGTPSGQIAGLANVVAKGDIAGIIISNPDAKYDVKAPSDLLKGANFKMIGFPFVKILFFAYQTHFDTSEVAFFAKNT